MPFPRFCRHRWSNVKRWQDGTVYHVIQRCRRCNDWVRRDIDLKAERAVIESEHYTERTKAEPRSGEASTQDKPAAVPTVPGNEPQTTDGEGLDKSLPSAGIPKWSEIDGSLDGGEKEI